MSKFKFINLIDTIFISITIFLIFFVWIQFFIKNIVLSLMLGSLLAIGTILGVKALKNQKLSKLKISANNSTKLAKFKIAIQTLPSLKVLSILKKLVPKNLSPISKKGDIIFTKDNKTNIYTFFFSELLTDSKLLEIIKNKHADNITIFCVGYNQNTLLVSQAITNIKIKLITLDELYKICEANNISVNTDHIDLTSHKMHIKDILKGFISPNKSKGYFISGLITLLTSLIIPYRIYYVVFSTILFALSIACKLNRHQTTTNILD